MNQNNKSMDQNITIDNCPQRRETIEMLARIDPEYAAEIDRNWSSVILGFVVERLNELHNYVFPKNCPSRPPLTAPPGPPKGEEIEDSFGGHSSSSA